MKFKNFIFNVLAVSVAITVFVACDDDNESPRPEGDKMQIDAYVLNQGNTYSSIASSIGCLDYTAKTATDSVFYLQNGVLPGNTLQYGVVYGSHFYAIAFDSNVLFVCDKNLKLQTSLNVSNPRAMATDGGYVYISNYDGHVTKLDTATMSVVGTVEVGPNPEEMAVANGYLYVVNSDGMNYTNNYANGKSVSKINLSTFTVDKTIAVGLNPTKAVADASGNIFIIAMGDYTAIPSTIQKIDANDNVTDVAEATMMAVNGNQLYAVKVETDFYSKCQKTYFSVNTTTLERTDNILSADVEFPISLSIDPSNGHIFVTSHTWGQHGPNYSAAGYLMEFDATGNYLQKYTAGVNPVQVDFPDNH
jgi:YVTN family beta-propeller protein